MGHRSRAERPVFAMVGRAGALALGTVGEHGSKGLSARVRAGGVIDSGADMEVS